MTLTGTIPYTIRQRRRRLAGRLIRRPVAVAASLVVVVLVVLVVFADLFAPQSPSATDLQSTLAPPSWAHPLGTDGAGRDLWSRLLHGGQLTLVGAVVVLVIALVIGVGAGLVAGYYGSWVESVSMWGNALIMALPAMVVLLAVRAAFGPEILLIMAAFGVLITPGFFLLVRSSVRAVRGELYVDAARVAGLGDARIIGRHILAAIRAPLIIQSMMVAGMSIGIQAALDFLGVGSSSGPTWGGMLSDGFRQVDTAPQLMLWPAVFIGLMTAALMVLGNEIRDTVEDRPRTRGLSRRERRDLAATRAVPAASSAGPAAAPAASAGDALLRVRGLSVAYATAGGGLREVVSDVSLDIARGEVVGLVGESGSGKTQIAFSILGLLPDAAVVTAGEVRLDGDDLLPRTIAERRASRLRGMAYIPQEPMANLDPCFTVGDQLTEPLRVLRGMSRREARETALRLLADVAIPDPEKTLSRYPHEISGGMAQRVLIAAALSLEPRLLVADEPTTALDVTVQSGVLALLRRLQRDRDLGVLLVTHDLGVAAELCDRIVVLKDGAVVERGEVEDVFYRPRADYTRSLLAATMADAAPRPTWTPPASAATGGAR